MRQYPEYAFPHLLALFISAFKKLSSFCFGQNLALPAWCLLISFAVQVANENISKSRLCLENMLKICCPGALLHAAAEETARQIRALSYKVFIVTW